jgi:hypothetical protein
MIKILIIRVVVKNMILIMKTLRTFTTGLMAMMMFIRERKICLSGFGLKTQIGCLIITPMRAIYIILIKIISLTMILDYPSNKFPTTMVTDLKNITLPLRMAIY